MRSMRQQLKADRRTAPLKRKKARQRVRRHVCKNKGCHGRVSFKAFNYTAMAWVHWPHPEKDQASYCHGCKDRFEGNIHDGPEITVYESGRHDRQSQINKARHAGDGRRVGGDPYAYDPLAAPPNREDADDETG